MANLARLRTSSGANLFVNVKNIWIQIWNRHEFSFPKLLIVLKSDHHRPSNSIEHRIQNIFPISTTFKQSPIRPCSSKLFHQIRPGPNRILNLTPLDKLAIIPFIINFAEPPLLKRATKLLILKEIKGVKFCEGF